MYQAKWLTNSEIFLVKLRCENTWRMEHTFYQQNNRAEHFGELLELRFW